MNSYGIGQVGDNGILSRSFEDLHPRPQDYLVIRNGTIDAQDQKAEQRTPPDRLCATCHLPLRGFLSARTYHPSCRPNVTPEPERPRMKSDTAQALLIERRRARRAA